MDDAFDSKDTGMGTERTGTGIERTSTGADTGTDAGAETESKRRQPRARPSSYAPILCQCGHENHDHVGPDKACGQCSGCKTFFAFPRCV